MNFKSRLEKLENEFSSFLNGIPESDLYRDDFKYKGKPFESMEAMFKGLNVTSDFAPYNTNEDFIKLFSKGLLSYESPEMQGVRKKASKQMEANL